MIRTQLVIDGRKRQDHLVDLLKVPEKGAPINLDGVIYMVLEVIQVVHHNNKPGPSLELVVRETSEAARAS